MSTRTPSPASTRASRGAAAELRLRRGIALGAWLVGLAPLLLLALDTATGRLGAEPVETLTHRTGWWALALLLASLAITPLRRVTGRAALLRARRPLGLLAFLFATLHLLVYFALDQGLELGYLLEDIATRPFITVGFLAWLLLLPLALTSTRGWIRRLGRRWTLLHRLVYLAAVLGVLHFAWGVKADLREPLIFATLLLLLLAARVVGVIGGRARSSRPRPGPGRRG